MWRNWRTTIIWHQPTIYFFLDQISQLLYFQLENCPTLLCVVVLKFNVVNFVTYLGRKLNPGMVDSVWFSKFSPERKYLSPIPCQRPFFNITICVAYIWRREEKWHPKGYCISILSQKYPNHQHKSWERCKKTNTFLSLFVVSFIFSPCVKVTALTNSHQTPQMYSSQKQREKYQTDGRTGKNSPGHEGPWQKKLLFRQLRALLSSECSTLSMFCEKKACLIVMVCPSADQKQKAH